MRQLSTLVVVSLVALQGGLLNTPAFADQPIRITQHFDFTRLAKNTSATCGFDVYAHIVGTFTVTGFKGEKSGVVVREIDGAHDAREAWSAPSKGTAYSYPINAPVKYDYPQGGTVGAPATLTIFGMEEKVPGKPAAAGKAVYDGVVVDLLDGIPLVDFDPEPVLLKGSNGATTEDRCIALGGA